MFGSWAKFREKVWPIWIINKSTEKITICTFETKARNRIWLYQHINRKKNTCIWTFWAKFREKVWSIWIINESTENITICSFESKARNRIWLYQHINRKKNTCIWTFWAKFREKVWPIWIINESTENITICTFESKARNKFDFINRIMTHIYSFLGLWPSKLLKINKSTGKKEHMYGSWAKFREKVWPIWIINESTEKITICTFETKARNRIWLYQHINRKKNTYSLSWASDQVNFSKSTNQQEKTNICMVLELNSKR